MEILPLILLIILVAGFIAMFTKYGRVLFDVALFITVTVLLLGIAR